MLDGFASNVPKKPTSRRSLPRRHALVVAAAMGSLSASARSAPLLTEPEGIQRVCNRGPDAALARARRLTGSAEVIAAGVLPNPSLMVQHQAVLSGPAERETIVGLSVPLGVSGRRGLLQDAALARREQAFADADATLFESALEFREAYVTALVDRARTDILKEQQLALEASSTAIEALAKSGEAAGYDLLRQRLQARIHRSSVASALARAEASRNRLSAWIDGEFSLPEVDVADIVRPVATASSNQALPLTRRARSLEAGSRASAIEARAARRRWLPDPDVFAGYRVVDGDSATAHGVSLSLTVPLTFFDHGQGDAARSDAEGQLLNASLDQLRWEQRAEAKAARARLEQLSSGAAELGQAQSEAHALLTQAQQLYSAGEASIAEMLEAFRAAEEARLAELEQMLEIALARLVLMRAQGTMFDPSLDRACLKPQQKEP